MNDPAMPRRSPRFNGWRIAGWGSLLALLLLPALAMQWTDEMNWTAGDFVFAAILLGFVGMVVELSARFARTDASRAGYIIAGMAVFLTFWINGAVGIIGDDDRVNTLFHALLAGGAVAGLAVRFRPGAMRWIAGLLALGQFGVGIAALYLMPGHAVEWGLLTFFALMWLASASCFARAMVGKGRASPHR